MSQEYYVRFLDTERLGHTRNDIRPLVFRGIVPLEPHEAVSLSNALAQLTNIPDGISDILVRPVQDNLDTVPTGLQSTLYRVGQLLLTDAHASYPGTMPNGKQVDVLISEYGKGIGDSMDESEPAYCYSIQWIHTGSHVVREMQAILRADELDEVKALLSRLEDSGFDISTQNTRDTRGETLTFSDLKDLDRHLEPVLSHKPRYYHFDRVMSYHFGMNRPGFSDTVSDEDLVRTLEQRGYYVAAYNPVEDVARMISDNARVREWNADVTEDPAAMEKARQYLRDNGPCSYDLVSSMLTGGYQMMREQLKEDELLPEQAQNVSPAR